MSEVATIDLAVQPPAAPEGIQAFAGAPLSVVFAEGEAIETVRASGAGVLPLEPPFHVSDEDAYLVLPDDIGQEIIDILQDGDLELLHEAMRDGLVVVGTVGRGEAGVMHLRVETACAPREVLLAGLPYVETVSVTEATDLIETINELPHLRCTLLSKFVDDEGLDRVLRQPEFVGTGWRVPPDAPPADPTLLWSRHLGEGRVGVELALFQEYEELVVLLRPLVIALT